MEVNNVEKMYMDLKNYCEAMKYYNSLVALPFAREVHAGVTRRGNGLPYLVHPLFVANYLRTIGLDSDEFLATSILHDTKEEDKNCGVENLKIADAIISNVDLLTCYKYPELTKQEYLKIYYDRLIRFGNASTCFVKFGNRYHNLSTMVGAFEQKKLFEYLEETKNFIYPYMEHAKQTYPEYHLQRNLLEYNIHSLVDNTEGIWGMAEKNLQEKYEKEYELKRARIMEILSTPQINEKIS